jgi:hypothetical protein
LVRPSWQSSTSSPPARWTAPSKPAPPNGEHAADRPARRGRQPRRSASERGLSSSRPSFLAIVVITSAGAYTAAPTTASTPAPTPSIAATSTAPDAIPQTAASWSRPNGSACVRPNQPCSGVSPHRERRLSIS